MPFVTTTSDQLLVNSTLTIDLFLSLTLDPNKEYVAQVLYLWEQTNPTDGGLQCCLAINGTGATMSQVGTFAGGTQNSGAPFIYENQSGPRLVIVTGIIVTGDVYTIVSAYRAQAQTSAQPTVIRTGSILQVGRVGQPFIPTNASLFLP